MYDGPPALVLQERSAEAGMLVLGSRGHGGFGGLLAGSTAVSVAAHAHCPVVVVRDGAAGARPNGPVAVGVDGSGPSLVALGFAAERAAQRQMPLRVLHAWTPGARRGGRGARRAGRRGAGAGAVAADVPRAGR